MAIFAASLLRLVLLMFYLYPNIDRYYYCDELIDIDAISLELYIPVIYCEI